MGKIIFLPKEVVAKTSAGEVVENPASVVKELIENSLDAGAHCIKISIKDGGRKRIVVADDGEGMCKEDLLISYKPHTSGKIKDEGDLERVRTFGFRGEALNSISCVSSFSIRSCVGDESDEKNGWEVSISFGKNSNISSQDKVKDKTKESSLEKDSLINEEINPVSAIPVGMPLGTVVTVDDLFANFPARQKFLKSSQAEFQKIKEVVLTFALSNPNVSFSLIHNDSPVLDISIHYNLGDRLNLVFGRSYGFLSFEDESDHMKFSGYLSLPQESSNSFADLYFYVNGRYIKWDKALQRVKKSYGTLLEKFQYPKGVLFLSIPPEFVDVNVHPRKEEVKIKNDADVLDFIERSARNLLEQHNLTYSFPATSEFSTNLYGALRDSFSPWRLDKVEVSDLCPDVLQIADTYLIASFKDRILMLDQHAAHEKILYAQIISQLQNGTEVTDLVLDLMGSKSSSYEENSSKEILLDEHLEEIQHIASTLACKKAVKAGDYLTPEERIRLVQKILETDLEQHTCPHGRPTMIELSKHDLERMFKRI